MSILSILNQISNISSTKTKLQILEDNKDNELFKQVCYLTYDKANINFYIKKIPEYNTLGEIGIYNLETCLNMLSKLYTRELTGNNAIEYLKDILINAIDIETEEVIKRIIKRDLKCGMGTTQVNKVWKDLIPKFPYQRISLFKDIKPNTINWENGVYSQLKEDSEFSNCEHSLDGEVNLYSRQGTPFPKDKFANIIKFVKDNLPKDNHYQGEMLVVRDNEVLLREVGNGILTSVTKGGDFADNEYPIYVIWDYIPLDKLHTKCKWLVPYSERYEYLKEVLRYDDIVSLVETRICYNINEVIQHLEEVLAKGLEGLVIKLPEAIWVDGDNPKMFKIKVEVVVSLRIKRMNPGEGKNSKTFGSINVVSEDELLEVNVSGFKDDKRLEIYNDWDNVVEGIMDVKGNKLQPPSKNNPKWSIFLPRYVDPKSLRPKFGFVEIRSDKDAADTLEEIKAQFESAILTIREMFNK